MIRVSVIPGWFRTRNAALGVAVLLLCSLLLGRSPQLASAQVVAPTVSAVVPASGSTSGGTPITVTGTGFVAGTTLTIGNVAATSVVVVSPTQITAITGARAAGSVAVIASSPSTGPNKPSGSLAGGFSYIAPATPGSAPTSGAPFVSSVIPATGPVAGGTVVAIAGGGFTTGATVLIGGVAASKVLLQNGSLLTAVAPANAAGAVDVVVSTGGASLTLARGYMYQSAAQASAPQASGPQSTAGTLHGGALPAQGFALVVFNGGSNGDLVSASGCPSATAAFWVSDANGEFVAFVSATAIQVVNAAWNAMFASGIPANTALIGRCA